MRPKERRDRGQNDLFKGRLDQIVDMGHPLAKLAQTIDWRFLEERFGAVYSDKPGQPPLPTRLMAGLSILKHTHNLSDEELCARWIENPYYQLFCGEEFFRHTLPFDRSSLTRWRQRMGEEKLVALIQESLSAATRAGAAKRSDFSKMIVDTTVQPKAVAFPTDAKLMHRARERLVRLAQKHGVTLRQSYARVGKRALMAYQRYAHAKQFRRANRALRSVRTFLGRVFRDIVRKIRGDAGLRHIFAEPLSLEHRVCMLDFPGFGFSDKPQDGSYSLDRDCELLEHFLRSGGETVHARARGFRLEGRRLTAIQTDRGDQAADAAIVCAGAYSKPLAAALGGLDALINNAGIAGPTGAVEDIDPAEWRRCIEVDLTGQFLCARRAVPMLKAAGGGSIINMSSAAGKHGYAFRAPYSAAKFGVIGFTQSLAKELGPANIRVNAILPGIIEGPRMTGVIRDRAAQLGVSYDAMEKTYLDRVSLRRMTPPHDVAAMVAFLLSDAGINISGQSISVDGNVETL